MEEPPCRSILCCRDRSARYTGIGSGTPGGREDRVHQQGDWQAAMRCPAATRCGTPAASVAGAAFIGEQGGEEGVRKAWARGIGEGGGVADGFGRLTLSCSSSVSGSYRKKKRGRARETRKRAGGRLGIRMRTTQGRASRRRHGQAAGWRAARGPTANGVREREKERVERKMIQQNLARF